MTLPSCFSFISLLPVSKSVLQVSSPLIQPLNDELPPSHSPYVPSLGYFIHIPHPRVNGLCSALPIREIIREDEAGVIGHVLLQFSWSPQM